MRSVSNMPMLEYHEYSVKNKIALRMTKIQA
jgi:hypothetical protein